VSDEELDSGTLRRLHRTITVVRQDVEALRYNTAIARLMELTTHAAQVAAARGALPRALAEPLVLMVAPLAPHIAEELWSRLGHPGSLAYVPFPAADPALAAEPTVRLPVQVNGKVRFTVNVPADAGQDEIRRAVTGHEDFGRATGGAPVERLIIVPGRIANVVTGPR
jgi:leucyl-tRNA synthetase